MAAIDFGSLHTRLAAIERSRQCPAVVADMPTAAYVPRIGPVLVGEAALEAIATDPAGAILNLKERAFGDEIVRQRRLVSPFEIVSLLFTELRHRAVEKELTHCTLTVPLVADADECEQMAAAARRAGFSHTRTIPEPLAALRFVEKQETVSSNVLVVCDLGCTAKLSVLRRPYQEWQVDWEILPPPITLSNSTVSRSLFDSLGTIGEALRRQGCDRPPLLLAGGGAGPQAADLVRKECWPGEILLTSAEATVLGALEIVRDEPTPPSDVGPVTPRKPVADCLSVDGLLYLGDDQLAELPDILEACRPKLRANQLRRLHLIGDDWRDRDVELLCQGVAPGPTFLEVTGAVGLSAAAMLSFARLENLVEIDLTHWRARAGSADGIRHLATLPALKCIYLPRSIDRLSLAGVSLRESLQSYLGDAKPSLTVH
jgi:hypothetical protein